MLELSAIADDSYLLSAGKVAAQGTPAQLRDSSAPAVRQFMTGSAEGPVQFNYPAPDYLTQLLSPESRERPGLPHRGACASWARWRCSSCACWRSACLRSPARA